MPSSYWVSRTNRIRSDAPPDSQYSCAVLPCGDNPCDVRASIHSNEQQRLLRQYRARWQEQTDFAAPIIHYELTCQYLKNVRAMQERGSHTDSDDDNADGDSIISDDDVPPLVPVEPSDPGSPIDCEGPPPSQTPPSSPPPSSQGPAFFCRACPSDGEGVERAWAMGSEAAHKPEEHGFVTASAFMRDGEPLEADWASVNPSFPVQAEFRHSGSAAVHDVQIISLQGTRDVKCDCDDGTHAVYTHRVSHAFLDADGHLVIKKSKTLLIPLN
ncbi:hypothetical protein DFH06DRAFT_1127794 [Mycena polygramma]|nr:hypothetical protein DFH06DRAFT_1127794 [Mycena polygramma]